MAREKFTPPQETLDALQLFASLHGRSWKEQLRLCWSNGWGRSLRGYSGEYVGPLQSLRNTAGGPEFLERYRLPK